MTTFNYIIRDELGIHARPAGNLVKLAGSFTSDITIEKAGKTASAKKLFAIMSLCVKKDNEITVTITGDDEDAAYSAIKEFFVTNL